VPITKSKLEKLINNLNKGRVLVIGDFAIDEMIYGQTHRISREAPVLILKHTHTNIILGGAANAANNIASLNKGKVTGIGVYGQDYHGPLLIEAMKKADIDDSHMLVEADRVTTTKTRISGTSTQSVTQQIVRIDKEVNEFVNSSTENKIIDTINKIAGNYDAILLSDYKIGTITDNIIAATVKAAKKHNLFLAVDAQSDLKRFKDADIITPNQPEAEKTLGYEINDKKTLLKGGKELLEKTGAKAILITRGSDGMVLFEKNGDIWNIPAFNKTAVFDVTGAGDTVVGSFLLALCAGATPLESALVGNLAASIVVKHFGCATTTIEELSGTLQKLKLERFDITKENN
jgi:D-glycero-beta-D-manno-heptose-7-phosphate kinase